MKFIDLTTDRLELIQLNMNGLNDMHEYSVKDEFYRFLEFEPFKNIEETRSYLKKLIKRSDSKSGYYWFIKSKKDKKIIGTFGVLNIDENKKSAEIGYGISPNYWGEGYFSEILKVVLDHLIHNLKFHRIWAKTQSNNMASIKGLQKIGFKKEGVLRDFYFCSKGKRHDAAFLSILSTEYS